jgi:hypothetical protein
MSELTVEFDSAKPDTIAIRSIKSQSLEGLQVPDDAIKFHFTLTKRARLPKIVSPFYFLSLEPLVLTFDQALARRIDDAPLVLNWKTEYEVTEFGIVAWQQGPARRSMIIPLTAEIVLLDRMTMAQVWPRASSTGHPARNIVNSHSGHRLAIG